MKTSTLLSTLVLWLGLPVLNAAEPVLRNLPQPSERRVVFERDIKPILERSCLPCHGSTKPKSGHRVDSRERIIKGGDSQEAAILPGKSENSPLVHYIAGLVPDMEMPPLDNRDKYPALAPAEIALIRAWVDQGVPWPERAVLSRRQNAEAIDGIPAAGTNDQEPF